MLVRLLTALLAVSLNGCAFLAQPTDWTQHDTRREAYYFAALAADSYTTAQFQNEPFHEGNPVVAAVIGEKPKPSAVWAGTLITAFVHYLIARKLKDSGRAAWQLAPMAVQGASAVDNELHSRLVQ